MAPLLVDTELRDSSEGLNIQRQVDLDPGDEDSGVFFFDDAEVEAEVEVPSPKVPLWEGRYNDAGDEVEVDATDMVERMVLQEEVAVVTSPVATKEEGLPSIIRPVTPQLSPTIARPATPQGLPTTTTEIHEVPNDPEANIQHPDTRATRLQSQLASLNSPVQSPPTYQSPTRRLQHQHTFVLPSRTPSNLTSSPQRPATKPVSAVSFTPPTCLFPRPHTSSAASTCTSVRARTAAAGRPAWWCKIDALVIFDGLEELGGGRTKVRARTSKGLGVARRGGEVESVVVEVQCGHCWGVLGRRGWKVDVRVCGRGVCTGCGERARWEGEMEREREGRRERADSVLQD